MTGGGRSTPADIIRRQAFILKTAMDGFWMVDMQGRLLEVNDAYCRMSGYDERELLGMNIADLEARESDLEIVIHTCKIVSQGRDRFESCHRRKDGSRFEVEVSARYLPDDGGRIAAFLRDITESKKAERLARRNQARLQSLVDILQYRAESTQDFLDHALSQALSLTESRYGYIYFYDEDRREFVLNTWSRDVMPACAVAEKQTCYELDKTGLWGEAVRQRRPIILNDYPSDHPLKRGCPEGHIRLTRFMSVPVFKNDRIVAVVGVANKADVYDQNDVLEITLLMDSVWKTVDIRRQEEEKSVLEAQLQKAQKMESIGTLAGGIAHDFNNMLFPIIGRCEMLLDDLGDNDRMTRPVRSILDSARRAAGLVRQILAFSRQTETGRTPVRIQQVLEEVLILIRHSLPATIDLQLDVDDSCRPVLADAGQIHQVLMNLISNAYHAMENTGGRLAIGLRELTVGTGQTPEPALPPGRYLDLSVSDTGTGIEEKIIHRIFDPYFTTKGIGKGTGLGLAVSYGIVKKHGGLIQVESSPGRGSTFHVYLPVLPDRLTAPEKEVDAVAPGGSARILFVDDEPEIVDTVAQMLERVGYRVTARTGSADALADFAAEPELFDIVITDMTMPGMTGIKLAAGIRRIRPGFPVILCTGFSQHIDADKAGQLGISAFAMKPIVRDQLVSLIRRVLGEAA